MSSSQVPQRRLFDRRFAILFGMQSLIICLLFIIIYFKDALSSKERQWDYLKELGSKLQANDLPNEAVLVLEEYFHRSTQDPSSLLSQKNDVKANLSFSIGELHEQSGNFEKALRWYHQVGIFDANNPQLSEARKRTVALLERMKKFSAAKMTLDESTALADRKEPLQQSGGTVIAKIGSRNVYLHEVNEAYDELPPILKESFKGLEGKRNFTKKFVADRLLLDKARRLNYEEDPEVRRQLKRIHEQLMLQKVLKEEIIDKIKVDDQDIRNHFEAHKEDYAVQENAEVSMIKVKDKEKAKGITAKLKEGQKFEQLARTHSQDEQTKAQGGAIAERVFSGSSFLGLPLEATQRILSTKEGKWTDPIHFQGSYYIFQIRKKSSPRQPTFDQIKSRVERDYKQLKEGFKYQNLIEESMKNQEVQLYLDKIK